MLGCDAALVATVDIRDHVARGVAERRLDRAGNHRPAAIRRVALRATREMRAAAWSTTAARSRIDEHRMAVGSRIALGERGQVCARWFAARIEIGGTAVALDIRPRIAAAAVEEVLRVELAQASPTDFSRPARKWHLGVAACRACARRAGGGAATAHAGTSAGSGAGATPAGSGSRAARATRACVTRRAGGSG